MTDFLLTFQFALVSFAVMLAFSFVLPSLGAGLYVRNEILLALALLLAGPALSLPNMLVIRSVLGTKKTVAFVGLVEPGTSRRAEYPEGVDEVIMEIPGKVVDSERLKRLYMTFARTLSGLCETGAAYETQGG